MAVSISAIFKLADQMSDRMDRIGTLGDKAMNRIEQSSNKADKAFSSCQSSASKLASVYKNFEGNADQLANAVQRGEKQLSAIEKTEGKTAASTFEYSTKLDAAKEAQDNLYAAMVNADKAAQNYENVMNNANSTAEDFAAAENELDAATRELYEAFDKGAEAALDLEEASEKAAENIDDLGEKAKKAGEKGKEFGDKTGNAVESLEQLLVSAGIAKLVKEITDALLDCAAAAEKVETSAAKLETLAGSQNMAMLKDQIYTISAATGQAQTDLYEVAYNAISAGTDVKKAAEITEAATKLATAGFTTSSSALTVLTTATNSYGKAAGSATDITDSLITVQNLGVTTVGELANSMGKSISTAAAYNVSLNNLESAYISVTKAGISTQEGTTYINAMITELGKSSSDVAKILREETGQSFGELMDAGYSLADVLGIIYERSGKNSEAMMNLWGSQTAAVASAAIVNQGLETFNSNLDALKNSAGATEKAYKIMADTTEYARIKMKNSAENLKISVGQVLNPMLEKLYNKATEIFDGLSRFAKEHPGVVKAITAIVVAIGAFVAVVTAAKIAMIAFTAILNTNPIILANSGVLALTAAIVSLVDAEEEMSYASQQQKSELEDLQKQYEDTCKEFGEGSYQAQELAWRIDELSTQYDTNRKTLEEWKAEFEEAMSSYHEFSTQRQNNIEATELEADKILNLATRLQILANKTNRSTAENQEMLAIIEKLNAEVPGLAVSYDELVNCVGGTTDAIIALAEAEAARRKYNTYNDELIASIEKRTELQDTLNKATTEYNATLSAQLKAQKAYDDAVAARKKADAAYDKPKSGGEAEGRAYAQYILKYTDAVNDAEKKLKDVNKEVSEAKGRVDDATQAIKDNEDAITTLGDKMATVSDTSANAFSSVTSVTDAIDGMASSLSGLAAEYEEAYNAAYESINGQFGLFDEAKANMESTVASAKKALDSQLEYWKNYTDNIKTLTDYEATLTGEAKTNFHELMTYVSSGTPEAAGLAADMAKSIKSSDEKAVNDLAKTLADVNAKEKEAAGAVADWSIGFRDKLNGIVDDANEAIDKLELSTEADANARATINAYADAITSQGGRAIAAAQSIANQVKAVLSPNSSWSFFGGSGGHYAEAYATGTDYASPGVHLVGENGPELVLFNGGEEVIPNDETERILRRSLTDLSGIPDSLAPTAMTYSDSEGGTKKEEKTINLNINGQGSIKVNGSASKDEIVGALLEYAKPILISVLEDEIIEEGDESYDY